MENKGQLKHKYMRRDQEKEEYQTILSTREKSAVIYALSESKAGGSQERLAGLSDGGAVGGEDGCC
jgi:hypothetical protein